MAKRFAAVGLVLTLLLTTTACSTSGGNGADEVTTPSIAAESSGPTVPSSSGDLEGRQYEDVVGALKGAGFTSIETVALGDLTTGWLKDPGEVKEVAINGETSFDEGSAFPEDAAVVISYHSFPEDPAETVLTAETSEDLADLLAGPSTGPGLGTFVEDHHLQTVQIDGCLTYILNSDRHSYSTADVVWGDCGTSPVTGPTFRFTPLMLSDSSPTPRDALVVGQNVRLTGLVGSPYAFEESTTYMPARDDRIVIAEPSIEVR